MSPVINVLNLNRAALVMLKEVQQSVRDTEDLRANAQVSTNTLYSESYQIFLLYFLENVFSLPGQR